MNKSYFTRRIINGILYWELKTKYAIYQIKDGFISRKNRKLFAMQKRHDENIIDQYFNGEITLAEMQEI